MGKSRQTKQSTPPQQQTLGNQLRGELEVVRRRRDDAAQLANALDISAQLADQCDVLIRERSELEAKVASLEAELLSLVAGDGPVAPDDESDGSEVAGDPVEVP